MKAKRKPLEILPVASLGVDTAPRLRVTRHSPPAERQKGAIVADVDTLVAALREKGFFNV
jgi:electron transfer flavoprotein beta subunit